MARVTVPVGLPVPGATGDTVAVTVPVEAVKYGSPPYSVVTAYGVPDGAV